MDKYRAFIIAERRHRIDENQIKINNLERDIALMEPQYLSITERLTSLAIEKEEIRQKLAELLKNDNIHDNIHKDNRILYHRARLIQSLSKKAKKKLREIEFTKIIKRSKRKNKFIPVGPVFKEYYKYLRQVEQEGAYSAIRDCFKQYWVFHINVESFNPAQSTIENLLSKYESDKESISSQIDNLIMALAERKHYPEKEAELRKALDMIDNCINQVQSSFDVNLYWQKLQQLTELKELNVAYQQQVENLLNISELPEIGKQKVKKV